MPNKQYVKGRKKEYKIVHDLKLLGYTIAQRTAGSHSPIDVFAINPLTHTIMFVQSKPTDYPLKAIKKLKQDLSYLTGLWTVKFSVV